MELRNRLQKLDKNLHSVFIGLTRDISPLLISIATLFPEFTRHDPSHSVKIEKIAFDILSTEAADQLTAADIFTLLCALWLHDAGMGVDEEIERAYKGSPLFKEKLLSYKRIGLSESDCWRDFVRTFHYDFCRSLSRRFLTGKVSHGLVYWVGEVAKSHGERTIHDRTIWPKSVAVGDDLHIHPPLLAAVLRLADILHFNNARAPEYMHEHRKIKNAVSLKHWKAHQIVSDYHIADDTCFFDGVTDDDEAYWFAHQFTDSMDEEVRYCKLEVLPFLDVTLQRALSFSRVQNRIKADGFSIGKKALTLRIEAAKFLEDLLNDSLYANKPTWFRETVQNAFDACRDRQVIEEGSTPSLTIRVDTGGQIIEFEDTGVGMSRETVENYLLVAGASFWNSNEYKAASERKAGHVGKFGIGFMSLFAVAERITVTTRHTKSDLAWKFVIRGTRRMVRVEQIHKAESGTTIKVELKGGTLFSHDIVDLFDSTCPFPEFPVNLIVDNEVLREFKEARFPSTTTTSKLSLEQVAGNRAEVTLLGVDIDNTGLRGDFYLPKLFLNSLNASVPLHPRMIHSSGWRFNERSQIYFGGVSYPALSSLDFEVGFTHVPSVGCLRLAVSPNNYPLEMNLARERFITGEGTKRLFEGICGTLDDLLTRDIKGEIAGKDESIVRSTIAAMHSDDMMEAWLGYVPSLSYIAGSQFLLAVPVNTTPWPQLTRLFMEELRFGCLDTSGNLAPYTIKDLLAGECTLFAIGSDGQDISEELLNAIFQYDSSAKLLCVIPSLRFGINKLHHWSIEEILVPVNRHNRCAYGLRFGRYSRPFEFFPRELDHLGLPVASGPNTYAMLDYREFMAEAEARPTGSPVIFGILNRKNKKALTIIEALRGIKDLGELYKIRELKIRQLREELQIGTFNEYKMGNRSRLAKLLSDFSAALNKVGLIKDDAPVFEEADFPDYFDGAQIIPFGRFNIAQVVAATYNEMGQHDSLDKLS